MTFIPKKKRYTFLELCEHWDCTLHDLTQAILDRELIPSLFISQGMYELRQLQRVKDELSETGESVIWLPRQEGEQFVREFNEGLKYLLPPVRTGGSDGEFHGFSTKPVDHAEGDIAFVFDRPFIKLQFVMDTAFVEADEVARFEAVTAVAAGGVVEHGNDKQVPGEDSYPASLSDPTSATGDNEANDATKQWWEHEYDVKEMAKNKGATLKAQGKLTSNSAIAKEIASAIEGQEKRKGTGRKAPSWDTIRGRLTGWRWKAEKLPA